MSAAKIKEIFSKNWLEDSNAAPLTLEQALAIVAAQDKVVSDAKKEFDSLPKPAENETGDPLVHRGISFEPLPRLWEAALVVSPQGPLGPRLTKNDLKKKKKEEKMTAEEATAIIDRQIKYQRAWKQSCEQGDYYVIYRLDPRYDQAVRVFNGSSEKKEEEEEDQQDQEKKTDKAAEIMEEAVENCRGLLEEAGLAVSRIEFTPGVMDHPSKKEQDKTTTAATAAPPQDELSPPK